MRFVLGLMIGTLMIGAAAAQERQFTVTLPESQWNMLAKIVAKSKDWTWEEANPVIQGIMGQIGQGLQQDLQARQKALAEIDQLKAEIERLKAQASPPKESEKP